MRDDVNRGSGTREPQEGEGQLRAPGVIRQAVPSAMVVARLADSRAAGIYGQIQPGSSSLFYCDGYMATLHA